MNYPWKNLVFEGGGIKGVAHISAVKYFMDQGAFKGIKRVAGSSAGAIQAIPLSLGYSMDEIIDQLGEIDFEKFKDGSFLGNIKRLINEFGLYKGDFFKDWMGEMIREKLGDKNATFRDLHEQRESQGYYDLYLVGTNVSRGLSQVFSHETTPQMSILEAARISMSFPFFFRTVIFQEELFCDGGLMRNYPIRLFDERRYLSDQKSTAPLEGERELRQIRPIEFICNEETLGFRVDRDEEIKIYKDRTPHFNSTKIENIYDYTIKIISLLADSQDVGHLDSNDWKRTVYISSKGIGTLDFGLSPSQFQGLIDSGREYAERYFQWWKDQQTKAKNEAMENSLDAKVLHGPEGRKGLSA